MLSLFNAGTGVDDQGAGGKSFSYGLRRARLDQVVNDPTPLATGSPAPTPASTSRTATLDQRTAIRLRPVRRRETRDRRPHDARPARAEAADR